MGDTFGVVGFGFGLVLVLDKDETAMTKFRLAMSMPAQLYWVLIINPPCIRLCCLATVRLCRWLARPLLSYATVVCLGRMRVAAGGLVAMIRVFRYTRSDTCI